MRTPLIAILFFLCSSSHAQVTETPEQLVQRQLDAYNAHDIDAFMDTYSDSIKLIQFPATVTTRGKDQMRAGYKMFFENNPKLHCEIKKRIVEGNVIIDQERVTGLNNGSVIEATAVYRVDKGKIVEVYFIR
jgi:uncharacterized protein (TIGR02246 family)